MWTDIATSLSDKYSVGVTATQVENRYKTVFKKTKLCIKNNRTSDATRRESPYDKEIANIISQDDSIVPHVLISAGKITTYVETCK